MFGSRFRYLFSYGEPQFDAQSYLLSNTYRSYVECAKPWEKADMKRTFLALRPNHSAGRGISFNCHQSKKRFVAKSRELLFSDCGLGAQMYQNGRQDGTS